MSQTSQPIPQKEDQLPDTSQLFKLPKSDEFELEKAAIQKFKKSGKYYDEMEIKMEDLDDLELRIEEMERYIGIEGAPDLDYFVTNDIEKLDSKCTRIDDFFKVIEHKSFMLNELYTRFDQLENFLKGGNKFTSQCIDLQKRSKMVEDSQEYIMTFAKNLNNIQNREKYLSFQPVLEPKQKLEQLKQLDSIHLRQLLKSEQNSSEIEEMLTNYNEIVQQISSQIEYLDMITADTNPQNQEQGQ